MVKLPYGGIEVNPEDKDDNGWKRLTTIDEYLEAGESIPPFLARWLGGAIKNSKENGRALLVNLGLEKPQGRQSKYKEDAWLIWGKEVCELEGDGVLPEEAISNVLTEMHTISDDAVSRQTLQRWRDSYRKACDEVRELNASNRE